MSVNNAVEQKIIRQTGRKWSLDSRFALCNSMSVFCPCNVHNNYTDGLSLASFTSNHLAYTSWLSRFACRVHIVLPMEVKASITILLCHPGCNKLNRKVSWDLPLCWLSRSMHNFRSPLCNPHFIIFTRTSVIDLCYLQNVFIQAPYMYHFFCIVTEYLSSAGYIVLSIVVWWPLFSYISSTVWCTFRFGTVAQESFLS